MMIRLIKHLQQRCTYRCTRFLFYAPSFKSMNFFSTSNNSNSASQECKGQAPDKSQLLLQAKQKYETFLQSTQNQSRPHQIYATLQPLKIQLQYTQHLSNNNQHEQQIKILTPICQYIDQIKDQWQQLNQDTKKAYTQCYKNLALAHINKGNLDLGIQKYSSAIRLHQNLFGKTNSLTLSQKIQFAKKLQELKGMKQLRLQLYSQVRDAYIEQYGKKSEKVLPYRFITLQLMTELFRIKQCTSELNQLVEDVKQVLPELDFTRLRAEKLQAVILQSQKDYTKAQQIFQSLIKKSQSSAENSQLTQFYVQTIITYAQCLRQYEKIVDGQTKLQQAINLIEKNKPQKWNQHLLSLKYYFATGVEILGYRDQAIKLYTQIKELYLLRDQKNISQDYINNQIKLITLMIMQGQLQEAMKMNDIVIEQVKKHYPFERYCIQRAKVNTAMILIMQKDFVQAKKIAMEVMDYFEGNQSMTQQQKQTLKKGSAVYYQMKLMLQMLEKKK